MCYEPTYDIDVVKQTGKQWVSNVSPILNSANKHLEHLLETSL